MSQANTPLPFDVREMLSDAACHTELRRIVAQVHRKAPNLIDESDLFQNVMLQMLKAQNQFHGTTLGEFTAWARTIAKRCLLDCGRQIAAKPKMASLENELGPAVCEDPSNPAGRKELFAYISGHLTERERALLRAKYRGGLTFEQMAALTGQTAESLRQTHHRLLARLRRLLGGDLA